MSLAGKRAGRQKGRDAKGPGGKMVGRQKGIASEAKVSYVKVGKRT